MSATINLEKKHFPVLLDEIIKIISPRYSGTFLDCTFGQGGYSEKILENPNNKIIAIDRDIKAARLAEKFKRHFKNRFEFSHKKFSDIQSLNEKNIKAIIFDLGYSTDQIFDNENSLSQLENFISLNGARHYNLKPNLEKIKLIRNDYPIVFRKSLCINDKYIKIFNPNFPIYWNVTT